MARLWALHFLLFFGQSAFAELKLPAIFSDGMVLQRQKPISIWGWANPGEPVLIQVGRISHTFTAGSNGHFKGQFPSLEAGGPIEINIEATRQKITKKISNVLIGEVWLAGGQSNMAWTVRKSNDFAKEKQAAADDHLRVFTVGANPTPLPQNDCQGSWKTSSPETVGSFSAVAYFMARKLRSELKVPVGLVVSAVGGTDICSWTSMEAQLTSAPIRARVIDPWKTKQKDYNSAEKQLGYETALKKHKALVEQSKEKGTPVPRPPVKPIPPNQERNYPANLFNGMINPLIPYTIRGVAWYQGEQNTQSADAANLYEIQLPLLILDWRRRFAKGDFPFVFVQLPNYAKDRPGWTTIRHSMEKALSLPNTGMVVTIDIGDPDDVHPTNKQDVGLRLAFWALAKVYGKSFEFSGPVFRSLKATEEGIFIDFDHASGLKTSDGKNLVKGFEISLSDGDFQSVNAVIQNNRVLLKMKKDLGPISIRYAWQPNPEVNLQNQFGLPARPFLFHP